MRSSRLDQLYDDLARHLSSCEVLSLKWLIFVIPGIGVFQTYYESQPLKKYSPSDIAWIPAMEIFMLLFTGPIVGRTFDNHGPAGLLFTGTLFHFLGLILISFCKEYYQFFLAQGMCSPLGASMVFYSSTNATNTWFLRRRALATGIVFSGSSLGGVILPIMVQRLIPQIGFPWTLRAAAFLILGCLIICNLTIRSRVPPTKKPFKIMDFIEPFQERTYVLLNFACFFAFWGVFIPFAFVILQGLGHGMSPRLAQYLVPILNAARYVHQLLHLTQHSHPKPFLSPLFRRLIIPFCLHRLTDRLDAAYLAAFSLDLLATYLVASML